ncbi:MAG TPA: DNA recombination protein RmuC [Candidatus Saccharimonadales bacterium]|nr:DNA recombination protein RmuC [Candidatus Saccharimonadales bacterium]
MTDSLILVGTSLAGVVVGAALTVMFLKNRARPDKTLQQYTEQLLTLADQKLGARGEEIKTDLTNKREAIQKLVDDIGKHLEKTNDRVRLSDEQSLQSFARLTEQLERQKQLTENLRGSTEDLKKVLSNNQLRGQFGEQVAENLLKMAGFVIGQDYTANQAQETSPNRPDFCVLLPDKTKVNIDVKFPYSALQKMTETDNGEEKKKFTEMFRRDVRDKVKQVTSRDYISPEEGTVDFVILFIPNEMIFSFIYEHLNDVWEEAMNKKVILAGPFSFTAMLRLIKQAHSNFAFQQNIHQVISLIQKFRVEYDKFSEEFDKVGQRIDAASKQFQEVSTTRGRQLGRVVDQIDSHSALEVPEKLLDE